MPEIIPLNLDGNARVYLSRADCSRKGYVYTEQGILTQIDLDTFQILNQIRVNGTCTGPVTEIY